eukprot:symbB.v1.2.004160.t1/scaffold235.1/size321457/19
MSRSQRGVTVALVLCFYAPLLWVSAKQSVSNAPKGVPSMRQAPIFPTRLDKKTLLPETSQIPKEQGVYCIYNHKGVVMYIGLSMNLQRSVETHARMFDSKHMLKTNLAGVKFGKMPNASKELLKKAWKFWLQDHVARGGHMPAGNMPKGSPGADELWQQRDSQEVAQKILQVEEEGPYR